MDTARRSGECRRQGPRRPRTGPLDARPHEPAREPAGRALCVRSSKLSSRHGGRHRSILCSTLPLRRERPRGRRKPARRRPSFGKRLDAEACRSGAPDRAEGLALSPMRRPRSAPDNCAAAQNGRSGRACPSQLDLLVELPAEKVGVGALSGRAPQRSSPPATSAHPSHSATAAQPYAASERRANTPALVYAGGVTRTTPLPGPRAGVLPGRSGRASIL